MTRVIQRCPNCGVEYDDPRDGPCEVCGAALRYWCRAHSKAIGWLDSPECPRCAAEAAARAPRAVPPRTPPPEPAPRMPPRPPAPEPIPAPAPSGWRARITTRRPPTPERREEPAPRPEPAPPRAPREIIVREKPEDPRPYFPTGRTLAGRLFSAVMAVIRNVIGWGVIGVLLAAAVAYYENADIFWFAMFGAMVGGGIGVLFGLIRALRVLFADPRPRGR